MVVVHCVVYVVQEVLSVREVVVNISDLLVDLNHALVVLDGLFCLSHVIEGVGNTDEGLNFLWIVVKGLLEVLAGILSVSGFE